MFKILIVLSLVCGSLSAAQYDPGASDIEIKIGTTTAYSGPLAWPNSSTQTTEKAYFKKINEQGGVNKRKIIFIEKDDAYDPNKTVLVTKQLVEEDKVFLIFSSRGTPTGLAVQAYLNQRKIPQLFVLSGAEAFMNPLDFPYSMAFFPSYQTEGKIYARYILKNIPKPKIGILYQNNDYGRSYVEGFINGLGPQADKMIVKKEKFEAMDPNVDYQIMELKNSGANVFFDISQSKFASRIIKKMDNIDWKPIHFLNSVAAYKEDTFIPAGLAISKGIISTTYLKDPANPAWKNDSGVKEYLSFMQKYYPEGNPIDRNNVIGYTAAQLLIYVLLKCGDIITHDNVMRQAAHLTLIDKDLHMLLPGITIKTTPTDYELFPEMRLERFNGTDWELIGNDER